MRGTLLGWRRLKTLITAATSRLFTTAASASTRGPARRGSWRRDDETHHNVLIDTARVPALLAGEGVQVTVASAFGTEQLPTGLRVLVGRRAA